MINIINILEFCTSPSDRGALASCSWTHSILIAAWLQLESAALPRVGRRVGAQAMHDDGPDLVPGRISSRGGCKKKPRFSTRAKTDMRITAKGNLRVVSPAHLPAWAGASKFQGASMESPGRHAGCRQVSTLLARDLRLLRRVLPTSALLEAPPTVRDILSLVSLLADFA